MMRRAALPLACAATVLLAGCGGQAAHTAGSSGSAASGKASSKASPSSASPSSGSASGGATAVSAGQGLPSVSGSYGDKPTLKFPAGPAPATLVKKVLKPGTGPAVAKGDLLVADYLGQVWGGKVFDNSYDRKQPAAFPIGVGQVIPGWDKALVGVKTGSRVLLSLPPADGYGTAGNTSAGIKGTDTLVFVVDVVTAYSPSAGGDPHATPRPAPAGITVTGALGKRPTVKVSAKAVRPTKPTVTVLDRATGPALHSGLAIVQYEVVDWSGKSVASTWGKDPVGAPLGVQGQPTVFDQLAGVPVGSRVLVELPAQVQSGQPASAAVIDVVAQPPTAKAQAAAAQ